MEKGLENHRCWDWPNWCTKRRGRRVGRIRRGRPLCGAWRIRAASSCPHARRNPSDSRRASPPAASGALSAAALASPRPVQSSVRSMAVPLSIYRRSFCFDCVSLSIRPLSSSTIIIGFTSDGTFGFTNLVSHKSKGLLYLTLLHGRNIQVSLKLLGRG